VVKDDHLIQNKTTAKKKKTNKKNQPTKQTNKWKWSGENLKKTH
jgi:hypothetical protein